MFAELRELLRSGAIRRHQLGAKDLLTPTSYDMSVKRPFDIHIIIYKFSQEVKRMLGEKLTKVIVYGSYARGDYRDNSDVDIMILVKLSDEEIRAIKNDIYDLAFDVEMSTGIEISPVIKNEEQYEYWVDTLPFYRNVRDEGVVVSE